MVQNLLSNLNLLPVLRHLYFRAGYAGYAGFYFAETGFVFASHDSRTGEN
jgi:hypothetical protein